MRMQSFVCSTRLCFGPDAPEALAALKARRVLIVTDPFFEKNGVAARYAEYFPGAETEIFSGVQPDPSLTLVAEGVRALEAFRPDTVLALGGGSAMGLRKGHGKSGRDAGALGSGPHHLRQRLGGDQLCHPDP